jgi:hypothetical protein
MKRVLLRCVDPLGLPFVGLRAVEDMEFAAAQWPQEALAGSGPAAAGAALHKLQRALQGGPCG